MAVCWLSARAYSLFARSLQKSELASFSREPGSLMPADYGTTLNRDELNDLISFLMFSARVVTMEAAADAKPTDDEEE